MKSKILVLGAFVFMQFVWAGCGMDDAADPTGRLQTGMEQQQPVELLYVKAVSRCDYGASSAHARFYGYIEVENIAYDKRVAVRYTKRQSEVWQDLDAVYLAPLGGNREVWAFYSDEFSYPARLSADFQFAVFYEVDGQTHWDNNGGMDYRISVGPRPIWPTDLVLGKSVFALRKANGYNTWTGNVLEGFVTLKNLAYDKVVKIVYTIDGWQTVREGFAGYGHPLANDSEAWFFSIPLGGGYGQTMDVEFALCYQVDGREYWDNNFGRNYSFVVPGVIE